jgi:hypothetical protein
MKTDVVLDALPIVISAIALSIAVVSMRRQWRSARNANAVAAILKLFEEYRTDELRTARRTIFRMPSLSAGPDSDLALRNLPDDVRIPAERVAHYFDHVGLLVGHRLVPAKPMISFFGFGCAELWKKLEPYVVAERRLRNVDYYLSYFEGFAALSHEVGADAVNKKMLMNMRSGNIPLK